MRRYINIFFWAGYPRVAMVHGMISRNDSSWDWASRYFGYGEWCLSFGPIMYHHGMFPPNMGKSSYTFWGFDRQRWSNDGIQVVNTDWLLVGGLNLVFISQFLNGMVLRTCAECCQTHYLECQRTATNTKKKILKPYECQGNRYGLTHMA